MVGEILGQVHRFGVVAFSGRRLIKFFTSANSVMRSKFVKFVAFALVRDHTNLFLEHNIVHKLYAHPPKNTILSS